jgi:hypothetical protein
MNRFNQTLNVNEIKKYVAMMKKHGFHTIVKMNQYITDHNLWYTFQDISRMNEFESGYRAMGISSEAYREIMSSYKIEDQRHARLVKQERIA